MRSCRELEKMPTDFLKDTSVTPIKIKLSIHSTHN
jgi:hypothetical protein